jgi:6-phosphogluconate dehydrogenase (decarboxylating)
MQLGMVGLGRMGGNIVRRLMQAGHTAVVYDRSPEATRSLVDEGATGALDLEDFVAKLEAPRNVWVMLPAGEITEPIIQQLASLLDWGDTIIDGGNTFWQDDVRRAEELRSRGLHYIDVAEVWRRGSVITSWLLDLTAAALAEDEHLSTYSGYVEDSGEGRWTIQAAINEAVPAEVLSAALYARFRSRQEHTFAGKNPLGHAQGLRRSYRGQEAGRSPLMTQASRVAAADPCCFVIFGASGDLTGRLLLPALYNLAATGLLPERFAIVGVARSPQTNEQFRQHLLEDLQTHATREVDPGAGAKARGSRCLRVREH